VVGADKRRNPDEDLPADFDGRRVEHYAALRKPIDASEFIEQLQHEMRTELDGLNVALIPASGSRRGQIKGTPGQRIAVRGNAPCGGSGWARRTEPRAGAACYQNGVARDGQRGSRLGGPFRGGPPQIAARRFTVTQHGWRRRPVLGGWRRAVEASGS